MKFMGAECTAFEAASPVRRLERAGLAPHTVPKPENLAALVHAIRGEKVLLDADLAELYGVETKVLNQAVKRNLDRFPEDFMFQLTAEEYRPRPTRCGHKS